MTAQEFMQEWEKKNNPFYPNEMRWNRAKINDMLFAYDESGTMNNKISEKGFAKGNEIIMNFDGWKLETRHTFYPDHNGGKNHYSVYVKEGIISKEITCRPEDIEFDIMYHKCWDALMPVVEKIWKLKHDFYIHRDYCGIIIFGDEEDGKYDIGHKHGDSYILSVWQAVVSFINWYNSNSTTP